MSNLYLIRHGQASYGTADYDRLSKLGAEQSRLTGAWFKRCGIEVHHAVAGALKRQVQTAEAFFGGYNDPSTPLPHIHRDPGFDEVNQVDMMNPATGENTGPLKDGTAHMTFEQFRENMEPAYVRWTSGQYDHQYKMPFPTYSASCAAAMTKAIGLARPGENVAAFTSGGTIAMICRLIMPLGDEATSAMMWVISNTSVSRLTWERGRFSLTLFNSLAHLEHEGDPALITIT
jgi:broad specificity phosphatase PhoE